MPKYKSRKSGEDSRLHKGKCASVLNFDISEQCVDEQKVPVNCDVDDQVKTDEESSTILDVRTFDEIMLNALDECDSKSYQIRSDALTTISTQLQLTHNPNFLKKHHHRLYDIIRYALNRTMACEIDAAASVLSLAAIQMPRSNRSFHDFYKRLRDILIDCECEYPKTSIRFAVYRAIGILTFFYETESLRIAKVMNELKDIFVDDEITKTNSESRIAALETWTFLMTLLPSGSGIHDIEPFMFCQNSVKNFLTLLDSDCYGLRVARGKAIAVIVECGLKDDKDCLEEHLPTIIEQLSRIIRYYHAKTIEVKSSQEVLNYLERGIAPHRELRNGTLILDNWALNLQCEMLCKVIDSANLTKHLAKNKKLLTQFTLMAQSTKKSTYSPTISNPTNQPKWVPQTPPQRKEYDCEKISKNLLLATHKSQMERNKALQEICKEFHLVPTNFLEEQNNVILDIIVKAMKRSDDTEQIAAVRLATLTVFQLGRTERFCSEISNLFLNSLKHSSSSIVSASICSALAFIELVDNEEDGNRIFLEPTINLFRQMFSGTQSNQKTSKEDGLNDRTIVLRTKALEAWGLLLTLCSPKDVCSMVKSQQIKELTDLLLQNSTVEFRIVCAQVISLIIERGRISEINYLKSDIPDICYTVKDIINDRKTASGDKRILLNTSLREVLKYLEDGCHPSFRLRFGSEIHELNTWYSIFKHHKLSQFIGQNLGTHLVENERLRDLVSIGPKPVVGFFDLPHNTQYKLSSAAKKKSKTKENRLNGRTPKYDHL